MTEFWNMDIRFRIQSWLIYVKAHMLKCFKKSIFLGFTRRVLIYNLLSFGILKKWNLQSHSTFKQISYLLINHTPWLSSNTHMAPSLQGDNTLDLKCDMFVEGIRKSFGWRRLEHLVSSTSCKVNGVLDTVPHLTSSNKSQTITFYLQPQFEITLSLRS
jgi:hypothetical protein